MEPHENMDELLPDFLPAELEGLKKTGPKMAGFRLPENYFEKLGDRFSPDPDPSPEGRGEPQDASTITIGDAALQMSYLPPSGGAGGGFSLPENYFEKLPDRFFEKMKKGGKTVEISEKRPFFNIIKKPAALAVAASMTVLVAALAFFFKEKKAETTAPIACNSACLSEKISAEDAQFYLSENLSEFSTEELAAEDLIGEINVPAAKKHQGIELDADDAEPILKEMLDDLSAEELEELL